MIWPLRSVQKRASASAVRPERRRRVGGMVITALLERPFGRATKVGAAAGALLRLSERRIAGMKACPPAASCGQAIERDDGSRLGVADDVRPSSLVNPPPSAL
jgi:hypothetical protein